MEPAETQLLQTQELIILTIVIVIHKQHPEEEQLNIKTTITITTPNKPELIPEAKATLLQDHTAALLTEEKAAADLMAAEAVVAAAAEATDHQAEAEDKLTI